MQNPSEGQREVDIIRLSRYCQSVIQTGCEKLQANRYRNEHQAGNIFWVCKKPPAVNKHRPVEAGQRFAFFLRRLNLFRFAFVFGRDDEPLAAGRAMCPFSAVFVGKCNQLIATGAVESDRHFSSAFLVLRSALFLGTQYAARGTRFSTSA